MTAHTGYQPQKISARRKRLRKNLSSDDHFDGSFAFYRNGRKTKSMKTKSKAAKNVVRNWNGLAVGAGIMSCVVHNGNAGFAAFRVCELHPEPSG